MKKPEKTNQTIAFKAKTGRKWIKPVVIIAIVLAIGIAAAIVLPNVLGAKRRHIMLQFLCEACILSVLGGIIGLLLSFGAVQIYNLFSATAVSMNWVIGMVAIGFCAVIGVLFGSYPAAKASRLQPIEALHTT